MHTHMVCAKRHAAYMFHISQQRRSCDNPGKTNAKIYKARMSSLSSAPVVALFWFFVSLDKQCIWPYVSKVVWDRPGVIRAYSFLKYSTIAVWYVYCNHTGENCAASAFPLGVRADHTAFARFDSVRGCARGTCAWAQLPTASAGCFHRLGRALRPRASLLTCHRFQLKRARASVDD